MCDSAASPVIRKEFNFIPYLRVAAMCLVTWPHMSVNLNSEWFPIQIVQWIFTRPLHIIQNFGALGVCIFYLISGFLMAQNTRWGLPYFFRRLLRVYLTVPLSMLIFFLFNCCLSSIFHLASYWDQFTLLQWIQSATLWIYLWCFPDAVNGVLWYLFPLLCVDIIYTLCNLFKKKSSIHFILITDIWILVSTYFLPKFTQIPVGFSRGAPFMAIPMFGVIIHLAYTKKVSGKLIISLGFLNYLVLISSFYLQYNAYYETEPYIVSMMYAMLIFTVMLLSPPPPSKRWIAHCSKISYSFYITHSLYGGYMISFVSPKVCYTVAFLCGIAFAFLMANINYLFVEKNIAKYILR